jgi:hypothetical protein
LGIPIGVIIIVGIGIAIGIAILVKISQTFFPIFVADGAAK